MYNDRIWAAALATAALMGCSGTDAASERELSDEVSTPSFALSGLQFAGGAQVARTSTLVSNLTVGITLEAWVRMDAGNTASQTVIYNGDAASNGYGLAIDRATPKILVGGVGAIACNCTLATGVWTHLAATQNNGVWQIFKNGALTPTGPVPLTPRRPTQGLAIGGTMAATAGFVGAIDDVRLWNRVRIPPEIAQDMSAALLGNEDGLAAYYRLDEGTGAQSADATFYGHTLTLSGGPLWINSQAGITTGIARTAIQTTGNVAMRADTVAMTATDNITLEAWVRWDGGTAPQAVVYNGDSGGNGYGIYLVDGVPRVTLGGVGAASCTTCRLAMGVWTHLAAVRARGTWQIYVNGTAGTVDNAGGSPIAPAGVLSFVSDTEGAAPLIGALDEVRLWNLARTATQIADNAAVSLNGYEPGLIAYYRIDEPNSHVLGNVRGTGITTLPVVAVDELAQDVTSGAGLTTAEITGR